MNFDEPLATFSWDVLLFVSRMYTLAPFLSAARLGNAQEVNRMLAKLRSSPKSVIRIDCFFLAFLLMLFSAVMYSYPSLPDWLKDQHGFKISPLDLAALVTIILLEFFEQRLLFGEREPSVPGEQ